MDCQSLPEMDIGEWGEHLNTQLKGQRYPLSATFEITERCNFNCVHCYINQSAANKTARAEELTTQQIKAILDQIVDSGCLFLTLTGGEPLLREDFPQIYRYAKGKGMLVKIFSNAALISPAIIELFTELPPKDIDITLYGATSEIYQQVTRTAYSYERVMGAIEQLISHQLPFSLKTMVLTLNRHELNSLRQFSENLDRRFRYDSTIWPRLDGSLEPQNYQLSLEDKIDLEFEHEDVWQEWISLFERYQGKAMRSGPVYNCGAGLRSFHIDSRGRLSLCTAARNPAYDLNEMAFQEAWENLGILRQKMRKLDTPCITCTLNDLCNLCPGWSQAVHGDDESPVEFLCQLAHMRFEKVVKYQQSQH
ncbi:MAG: radical SAM/SPASM domain-containing protein [Anaerolineales bacterium]